MVYSGHMNAFDIIKVWAQDKCVPLVREITFENAEVRSLAMQISCFDSLTIFLLLFMQNFPVLLVVKIDDPLSYLSYLKLY